MGAISYFYREQLADIVGAAATEANIFSVFLGN